MSSLSSRTQHLSLDPVTSYLDNTVNQLLSATKKSLPSEADATAESGTSDGQTTIPDDQPVLPLTSESFTEISAGTETVERHTQPDTEPEIPQTHSSHHSDPHVLVIQPLPDSGNDFPCDPDSSAVSSPMQEFTNTTDDHHPRQLPISEGSTDDYTADLETEREITQYNLEITAQKEKPDLDIEITSVKPPPARSCSVSGFGSHSFHTAVPHTFNVSSTYGTSFPSNDSATGQMSTVAKEEKKESKMKMKNEKKTWSSGKISQASLLKTKAKDNDTSPLPATKHQRLDNGQTVDDKTANTTRRRKRTRRTKCNLQASDESLDRELPANLTGPVLEVADQWALHLRFMTSFDPWGDLFAIPLLLIPDQRVSSWTDQRHVRFMVYCGRKTRSFRKKTNQDIWSVIFPLTRKMTKVPGSFYCIVQYDGNYYRVIPQTPIKLLTTTFNTYGVVPLTVVFKDNNVNRVVVYFWISKTGQTDW